jgi:hypothetical protein
LRKVLATLALVFVAAHLPFLPPTLEDIDSINFALGVRHFDVAHHQPHPPGYPVFIALGKISTGAFRAVGVPSPEVRGLAVWSTISGIALIWLLFVLYRSLDERGQAGPGPDGRGGTRDTSRRAAWTTVIAITCPLFWFTSLRPLSDMTGLAGAVAAQALIVSFLHGRAGRRALICAGVLAGLAIGLRSQTFLLTLPLLGTALIVPRLGLGLRDRAVVVAAVGTGVLAWAIPLVVASGGLSSYAAALGTQAGEDFSGVVMLWNVRSARLAADALMFSFLWPWGGIAVGGIVVAVAAAGAVRTGWERPRVLLLLIVGFVPYAIFHLLFHEFVTVRYALPLIVPVAYLVAAALAWPRRTLLPAGALALATMSLVPALPAAVHYARQGSPAFRALARVERGQSEPRTIGPGGSAPVDAVGMHAVARRAAQWEAGALPGRLLDAPHGREWLALVQEWRSHPRSSIAFIADPRRTDLVLIDPSSRRLVEAFRWGFIEPPFVGGARPGNSDLYRMSPPRWMLDRGWALSAEVAGVTARDRLGPHRQPSVAWVKGCAGALLLMVGGRHLGDAGDPSSRITVRASGVPLASFDVQPGFFFRIVQVPAGTFASSDGYLPLEVSSAAAGANREIPVSLEQFDLQGAGVPMIGVAEGWQEPEYSPQTSRAWRWTTERSALWVRPVGRDVRLVLEGESPLRYFDSPPTVTVTVAGRRVARFNPAADFRQEVLLPADALAAADGRVVLESDKWFVPGERTGTGDRRRLALRIYSFTVE